MFRLRPSRTVAPTIPLLLATCLTAATAAAPAAGAAAAKPGTPPGAAAAAAPGGHTPEAAAIAQARATGKPVAIPALTTPTSQTTANPDGSLTLTQSLRPARAWKAGKWVPLDASLAHSGRWLVPAASAGPLALSGGGTGPFAILSAAGRSLALSWPSALPAPVISGSTATYRNVLPEVDLAVTADIQGGISDTLIIHSAAATANPALKSLKINATPSGGLALSADAAGNLAVSAGGKAQPVFTAQPSMMWDSAPPPVGMATITGAGGVVYGADSGMPAYSSLSAPGAGAHVTRVPLTTSGTTITMAPPASALAGPGVTYPVYVDPTWVDDVSDQAANWTQVDSGNAGGSYWREGSDLQLGLCDFPSCGGIGVERAFFTMPISSALTATTSINYSYVYMTDQWASSCTKESVGLYTTSAISSATTWNKQPTWASSPVQTQSFALQDPALAPSTACPMGKSPNVTWNIASVVKTDAGHVASQAFGLKAGSETNDLYWKKFYSGATNITIATNFDYIPNAPYGVSANGVCGTASNPSQIGYNDVTLAATPSDDDYDVAGLLTTTTIYNADGTTADVISGLAASPVSTVVPRTVIAGWHTGTYTYHFSAQTTDSAALTGPASAACYFTYNPTAPAAPTVVISPAPPYTLGQAVTATITAPSGCGTGSNPPCPTGYTYQYGIGLPQPATIGVNNCALAGCPVSVTLSQLGPVTLTVNALASGNISSGTGVSVTTGPPAIPYKDGYFAGGAGPNLLIVPSGSAPSLWLGPGAGPDIGGAGTGINPPNDGPADWCGTNVLHGDFTGDKVQDVIAYYPQSPACAAPHAGNAVLIPGDGTGNQLLSASTYDTAIPSWAWTDLGFDPAGLPATLVAAGNASQNTTPTGMADLIGAYGDSTAGYELALYTIQRFHAGTYGVAQQLSPPKGSPDATTWDKFSLATAQPGANPNNTVLFALDTTNGNLYESVNPYTANPPAGQSCAVNSTQPICGIIGSTAATGYPGSTWTKLTVPTGTTLTKLLSADINPAGQTEVWASDTTGTTSGYSLSGATLASEGSGGGNLSRPSNDWPLADGACGTASPAIATETVNGRNGAIKGGFGWTCDNVFGAVLSVDGTSGYVLPPTGVFTYPTGPSGSSLSIWFKTSTPNGVIAGMEDQIPGISDGNDYPLLYIGTDGKLYGDWPMGGPTTITSLNLVDDGLWHQAVLTFRPGSFRAPASESLIIDGVVQDSYSGFVISPYLTIPTYLTFGAGYIGSTWPNEKYFGAADTIDYFNGQLANVTLSG